MSSIGTKPITLVTASPGGGKTAQVVALMQEALKQGRPLIQQGIPDLKLDHGLVPPIAEWTEIRKDPETGMDLHYFTFPQNALVVLDEAQRIFRTRTTGSKVPAHVAAFETVRHTGVTFILMTQHPSFLDSHIRKLVGQHIHLRDVGLLGRWYYEWPETEDSPEKTFNTAPIKRKFKLPKHVFGLYKSSSLHIKRKYSVPPVLMLFFACLLIALFLVWRTYGSISSKISPEAQLEAGHSQSTGASAAAAPPPVKILEAGPTAQSSGADYMVAFTPTVPGKPESAPAYASLRQVKSMPQVVGGGCMHGKCRCYNQQGTDAGLDDMQCRAWLSNPPFDPYRDPAPVGPAVNGSADSAAATERAISVAGKA